MLFRFNARFKREVHQQLRSSNETVELPLAWQGVLYLSLFKVSIHAWQNPKLKKLMVCHARDSRITQCQLGYMPTGRHMVVTKNWIKAAFVLHAFLFVARFILSREVNLLGSQAAFISICHF